MGQGIEPVPEKLESIKNVPRPRTPKEIKQFLGLIGYYRKFVPRFADIARPLSALTRKDVLFEWTQQCQAAFELLKEGLMKEPILKYPDPNKLYTLYTDASKYAWACVLTQQYEYEQNGKIFSIQHPITYVSGLFKGSQLNWVTLTKEAYAIYASVRKLSYYLEDSDIVLRSDHLPLRKFPEKNTSNTKVNNWAIEISPYRIKFEYIKGIKNTLADTMSRLIKIDPDIKLLPEPEGYEFGCYAFDYDSDILVNAVQAMQDDINQPITNDLSDIDLPLTDELFLKLQKGDKFCKHIKNQLLSGKLQPNNPYYLDNDDILKWYVTDNKQRFEVVVLPESLILPTLKMTHDDMGHNGSARTYMTLRRQYYWKGLKKCVYKHVKQCCTCLQCNKQAVKYTKLHFTSPPSPMKFISMDLIGEFHPPSSKCNKYALTVICMHTSYTFCIPLKTKKASEVLKAYIDHVHS